MSGSLVYRLTDWGHADFVWQQRHYEMERANATSMQLHVTVDGMTQILIRAARPSRKSDQREQLELDLFAQPS